MTLDNLVNVTAYLAHPDFAADNRIVHGEVHGKCTPALTDAWRVFERSLRSLLFLGAASQLFVVAADDRDVAPSFYPVLSSFPAWVVPC